MGRVFSFEFWFFPPGNFRPVNGGKPKQKLGGAKGTFYLPLYIYRDWFTYFLSLQLLKKRIRGMDSPSTVKGKSSIGSESTPKDVEASEKRKKNTMTDEAIPDGGLHAWIIVLASFLTNGIIFGIHNCYGILYLRLKNELEQSGVGDAATKACKFHSPFFVLLSFFAQKNFPFLVLLNSCCNNESARPCRQPKSFVA